ncbi:Eco57I restriction-modification methylase domain-containing protein [Mesorhizobium sp. PUT5]|uniref:Eco57I restriction-modification methylase domain-containing protein n=1 Tax=Mesorhizobium sp. PUT5 TaxID=3454629 RepID=UPI003FA48A58
MIRTERQLAALSAALIPARHTLTAAERKLCAGATVDDSTVESTRALILAGDDPLGELFGQIRSAEDRREHGATYTPAAIVDAMIAWAADRPAPPVRVVDAGAGSGRFTIAAARRFSAASLVAVETDPLATLMLRANASVLGFADRLTVKITDYRRLSLPKVDGPTLFIGNPPYVRHHDIGEEWKNWLATQAAKVGFKASKLAGLHVHFFLKTRLIGRQGDYGAFITAAEWLDVNYGRLLRDMLADGLGGTSVHLIDPKAMPFADALTTGAITCFQVGQRPDQFTMRSVDSVAQLADLSEGRRVSWADLAGAPKWSSLIRSTPVRRSGMIELGELFRVHRGQVTGGNAVWVHGVNAPPLPERFLLPAVTKARELLAVEAVLRSPDRLRRVVDLPADLEELTKAERRMVDAFLKWARTQDADLSYVARHRRAWWSVGYKEPAAILCTYMARRAPHFVRNAAKARHINIAHGLYPRDTLPAKTLDAIVRFLHHGVTTEGGRIYAGGLVKFEPKEIERIAIPRLETLHDFTDEMDITATRRRLPREREGISSGTA